MFDSAINRTRESHAEVDANTRLERAIHSGLIIGEIEIGEKAEGAESEGKNWRNYLLE